MYYVDELKEALKTIDFERFETVYIKFREGEIETKIEDIPALCDILTYKDPKWDMEPHQEQKMYEMILITADEHGYSNSLYTVLMQLDDMIDKQKDDAIWILKILSVDLENEENMNAFLSAFDKLDIDLQSKIRDIYKDISNSDYENYIGRANNILDGIGYN